MPASGVIKLADANVWLAVAFSDHLHHAKAKAWFDGQGEDSCAFCRVTQMALLRHLTNTRIMDRFVQSQQDAWKNYDKLANDPRVVFLTEPATLETTFRSLTQASSPSHGLWTDAYLAAFALVSQCATHQSRSGLQSVLGTGFACVELSKAASASGRIGCSPSCPWG